MSSEGGGQTGQQQALASTQQQVVTTSTTSGQMTTQVQVQQQSQPSPVQQQQPQQQQLQLQQATTTTLHSGHHQQNQGANPMQQLQFIQQPMQNQAYLQQLYNSGQLVMSGNILHQGINPHIQVIAAGKPFQPNQLTSPHMLTAATSYTIPTSAPNNSQSYIIGPVINSQPSLLQHQQGNKPGEIQKIISPQIGAQLPQGLWSPHNLFGQNILIRTGQNDQQQMYIQSPQHNNIAHQHFSMPLTATASQLPTTSISPLTSTTMQQTAQQQSPPTVQQTHQQHQPQTQHSIQPQQTNLISVKTPITLQPKPQIQPQPSPQQPLQQHVQQVTVHQNQQQIQMIPQTPTSLPQSISITQQGSPQTLATHIVQQQQNQQQPRQLTILPQQNQPVQIIQTAQQPQPIRPNPSYTTTTVSVSNTTTTGQAGAQMTPPNTTPRTNKIRKPAVARSGPATGPQQQQPQQQAKQVFPRMPPNQVNSGTGQAQQPRQIQPSQGQGITLQPVTRIPIVTQQQQQQQILSQPLKTINMAALQPNLPDATLTPLTPQSNSIITSAPISIQQVPQQLQQVFQANVTQLPSPNVSITPTNSLPTNVQITQHNNIKKEENSGNNGVEIKAETEKENNKSNNSMDDQDDGQGKQKLPKAMVKPQVLTHVIEGFVIQEAASPFPMPTMDMDEPSKKKLAMSPDMAKCELCGTVDLKAKFKRNKRFCSSACAKGMKNVQQKHQQQQAQIGNNKTSTTNTSVATQGQGKNRKWGDGGDGDTTDETNSSAGDTSTLSPTDDRNIEDDVKVNPMKWDVTEVVDFVKSLPGCSEYANDFAEHEIDGQALLLLKADHLMSAMNMKLGPALKLCAKIEYIRSGAGIGESART